MKTVPLHETDTPGHDRETAEILLLDDEPLLLRVLTLALNA